MKTVFLRSFSILFAAVFLLTSTGCKKEQGCTKSDAINYDAKAEEDDGSCQYKGKVTFWNQIGSGLCTVEVKVNNTVIGNITQDLASTPNCGAAGTATFEAKPGTYTYYAYEDDFCDFSDGSGFWTNTFTIESDGCLTLLLQ